MILVKNVLFMQSIAHQMMLKIFFMEIISNRTDASSIGPGRKLYVNVNCTELVQIDFNLFDIFYIKCQFNTNIAIFRTDQCWPSAQKT